ncbi:hypothetical protein MHYP_G00169700 [Metynnis hypsauchen]
MGAQEAGFIGVWAVTESLKAPYSLHSAPHSRQGATACVVRSGPHCYGGGSRLGLSLWVSKAKTTERKKEESPITGWPAEEEKSPPRQCYWGRTEAAVLEERMASCDFHNHTKKPTSHH